ncbi:hypothetical protein BGZ83_006445 [Gryganskiella cystojenkinii]|nr:hypothetical protein BGZ83_006445 [Gryganskiella cystojenkinii]
MPDPSLPRHPFLLEQQQQQQQHRALDVPEILNHVGYFLSQKDAVGCIRVSKFWHQVLSPVLWEHVETSKWSSWLLAPLQSGLNCNSNSNSSKEPAETHSIIQDKEIRTTSQVWAKAARATKLVTLDQALERYGDHIRTLSIIDFRAEGLLRLVDRCSRLETLALCPDAFEEDADDDDDDLEDGYYEDENYDDQGAVSGEEEDEEEMDAPVVGRNTISGTMVQQDEDQFSGKNPIVNLLLRNTTTLSRVEIFVGLVPPSASFWRALASTSATFSSIPLGLPSPVSSSRPPMLPSHRQRQQGGLRSFQSLLGLEIKTLMDLNNFLQMFSRLESLELENCSIRELPSLDLGNSTNKKRKRTGTTTASTGNNAELWFPRMRHVRFGRIRSLSVQSQFRLLQACPDLESLDWRVSRIGFPVNEFCETLRSSCFHVGSTALSLPRWTNLTSLTLPESRLKDEEFSRILRAMQSGLRCLIVRRSEFGREAFGALMKGYEESRLQDVGAGSRRSSASSTLSFGSSSSWTSSHREDDSGTSWLSSSALSRSWTNCMTTDKSQGPEHWRTLSHLDLGQCRAVSSMMTQSILSGCAKLESFDGYQILADDLLQYTDVDDDKAYYGRRLNDESQSAMEIDDTPYYPSVMAGGLISPPASPSQDSPLRMSKPMAIPQPTTTTRGRSTQQEPNEIWIRYYSPPKWTYGKRNTRVWWACERTLRHLDVHISGLGPYPDPRHRAVFEQLARLTQLVHLSIGSKANNASISLASASASVQANTNTSTLPPVAAESEKSSAVFTVGLPSPPSSPLSVFTSSLDRRHSPPSLFGSSFGLGIAALLPPDAPMPSLGGLDLRLRSGLGLLAPLKKLRMIRFTGNATTMIEDKVHPSGGPPHWQQQQQQQQQQNPSPVVHLLKKSLDLDKEDLQWMVEHLWELKIVEGRLHSDAERQKQLIEVLESQGVAAWTSFNQLP